MRQPSIKKNVVFNTLYQIITLITPLITAPYISRVLEAEGIGIYSFTNSIVTYFTLVAALGTASYGQREIAMHRNDFQECSKRFWEIEILSIFTTCIAMFAWIIWIVCSNQYSVYYGVLTISIIAVAFDISWFYAGFEKFQYIVIRNAIVKLFGIILIFLLVKKKDDILVYIGIMSVTGFLGNVSMWTYLPRMIEKVNFSSLHPFKNHLRQTVAYFIPTIATSVYTVLDKTMIGVITSSESQNGYYEQATKIIRMFESVLFSLNTVMSARQSFLFSEGKIDEIKEKINKSFEFLFAIAIPFIFGLVAIANNFVNWFFGKGYEPVVKVLYFMSLLPLIICISNILGSQYLTPSGQRTRSTKGIMMGALTNLILNSILIPLYGAIGATIASIFAELVISIIYMKMSRECIGWSQIFRISIKKIIAAVIMFAIIYVIGKRLTDTIWATVIQIVVGIVIYTLTLVLLRDDVVKEIKNFTKK